MRAIEFLAEEEYEDTLKRDLEDLLIRAKANDQTTVPTQRIVDRLISMGYSATPNSVLQLLAQSSIVANATEDEIQLDIAGEDERSPEENREIVNKMAQKAVDKNI